MIKLLASAVGEYKKAAILSPLFISLEVILEVVIPLLMAYLIDRGIDAGSLPMIVRYGLMLVVAALFSLLFGVLSGHYAAVASAGYARNLRRKLFYAVQDFSFANIDKFSTASLVTRLTTDVTNIQGAFMMIIRVAVRCPLMLGFALAMSFAINSRLAMIYAGVIPVLGLGLFLIMSNAHPIFERVFRSYDRLNNVVRENLRGIRVVKAFVREQHEVEKFSAVSESIYRDFSRAERLLAFNAPLMQLCLYATLLLISWFAAQMIVGGEMTTGELVSLITYTMQVLMNLMMLSMVFVMITISRASAKRICEVLREQPDIVQPPAGTAVREVADGSIVFEHTGFSYAGDAGNLCLSGVDLAIASGETMGIIGGTGSSKTTLVQLIPRLYDVTVGRVLVGGVDVRDYELAALRQAVGMVLQKNVLFAGTVADNLRWGDQHATDEELRAACRLAQADGFISEFEHGYQQLIEQGGSNVSGGQRQRLCIARALLKKPRILILDDSTSAVDTATDAALRHALAEYMPETTKIIIAQRVASVMHADKIVVMDQGTINGIGTHQQLLAANAIYREIYYSQTQKEAAHE
ncbi:MAG: ABC transporter ATP-binding protein [Bacillota bacterium]|nr:ABC transporter ATP-binding protein [Bacillota bacterium]